MFVFLFLEGMAELGKLKEVEINPGNHQDIQQQSQKI